MKRLVFVLSRVRHEHIQEMFKHWGFLQCWDPHSRCFAIFEDTHTYTLQKFILGKNYGSYRPRPDV